jgi:hypothetical protein
VSTEDGEPLAQIGKLRALAVDRKGALYVATQGAILRKKP